MISTLPHVGAPSTYFELSVILKVNNIPVYILGQLALLMPKDGIGIQKCLIMVQ